MDEVIKAAKRLSESCNYSGIYDCEHCPYVEMAEDGMGCVISCSGDYKEDVRVIVDNAIKSTETIRTD